MIIQVKLFHHKLFLSLLQEKDTSDYFSDDTLVVLVNNLFAAGTESTVSTLRWGIFYSCHDVLKSRVSLLSFRVLPEGEEAEICWIGQCRILEPSLIPLICTLEESLYR